MSGAPFLASATLMELAPDDIDEGDRIGFLHEDKAAAIGRLMAVDGQRDPIKVVKAKATPASAGAGKPWRLVTGMHRLMGARYECITVFAIEVTGKPEDLADLEASENLHRRPLGPIERAKFTAALVRASQERIACEHGALSHWKLGAKARWDRVKAGEERAEEALRDDAEDAYAKMAQAYGWEESVGEALDMSRRTIHRDLSLSRLLIEPFPELIEALARHPVVGENASQLKAVAGVKDEAQRRAVIEALLADDELSADEARVLCGIDQPDAPEKSDPEMVLLSRAIGTLGRMKEREREAFVEDQVLKQKVPVMRRIYERLGRELQIDAPRRVGVPQAAAALSETIAVVNALLDGTGVDDEQLAELRQQAQAVVFDIAAAPEADR